jgi:MoaA/NifB/PqqE/SkfB family radical SAM enzyme
MASLAYIQVTRKCNQECRFCSNPPNRRTLSLSQGKNLIDMYIKKGFDGIIFTGGEPTLSPCLPELIRYATFRNIAHRMITNGQKIADLDYLVSLKNAGLYHLHLSMYSCKEEVQVFLTKNKESWRNIIKALNNLGRIGGISVDLNITINHYNADHLLENVKWVVKNFPFVRHFVWNNLDPVMSRAKKNLDTVPKFNEFELSLQESMKFLNENGKTFRTERIPLCYLPDNEDTLNETRKIVKKEKRMTFFLDNRGFLSEQNWLRKWGYGKGDACKKCSLTSICPGLYQMNKTYSENELYPVFVDKQVIIKRIINGR